MKQVPLTENRAEPTWGGLGRFRIAAEPPAQSGYGKAMVAMRDKYRLGLMDQEWRVMAKQLGLPVDLPREMPITYVGGLTSNKQLISNAGRALVDIGERTGILKNPTLEVKVPLAEFFTNSWDGPVLNRFVHRLAKKDFSTESLNP
jgi:hypothetical protein